ncbi:histidine phosphatase family protein [Brevibacillus ginsengisoli]|uniref:histidine phosphatase family protein n=1 Tax=Brevibacillus ginsengisoli TaxID=363854 RepID=UPI003CEE5521
MNRRDDQMIRVILMRHGETDWNKEKRVQGTQDIPLNDLGRVQVRETAQKFIDAAPYSISQIITSPLRRAKESALICQELLHVPLIEGADWRERSFGSLEGMTVHEIQQLYQIDDFEEILHSFQIERQQTNIQQRSELSRPPFESIDEISLRITRGLQRILETSNQTNLDGHILIVTHGSIIKRLSRMFGQDAGILHNAGFVELWINKREIQLLTTS